MCTFLDPPLKGGYGQLKSRANGHQIRILLIEIYKHTSLQPKRTQPAHVFNNFSIFWHVTCLFLAIFLFFFLTPPNIPLPNDSSHKKASAEQKVTSIGWIFLHDVSKKLCKMQHQYEKKLFGISVKGR